MKICIAVFRSKTETYKFIEYMRSLNVECSAVSTPKEARVGCGISAKFQYANLQTANRVIANGNFKAFKGIFIIEKRGNRSSTVRI